MYLGIEIGGTKLQLGLGAGDGRLAGLWRADVDVAAGAAGIRQQIVAGVPALLRQAGLQRHDLRGVGFGFGGPVDDATRAVLRSHQVGGWDGFPLAAWAEEQFGVPAVLGNDADVAGLAEALFGAGRGLSPVFYITVGSGIGGGLILDGKIYRGCGKGAAEIGHLRVPDASGVLRPLEKVASGWGIESLARERRGEEITAREVGRRAAAGDAAAQEVLAVAHAALAEAICHVVALVCPRRIAVGGGVSLMGEELFFAPLRREVAARVFVPFADCFEIVPAALGEEVVVHGALALARSALDVNRP